MSHLRGTLFGKNILRGAYAESALTGAGAHPELLSADLKNRCVVELVQVIYFLVYCMF